MSANGYAVLQELSGKLAQRTIQVTVSPRPTRFAERRAVLHALQKFGRVEVFKKLDNHDSSFIAVLSDKSQVKDVVNKSPLAYQLAVPRPHGSVQNFLTSSTSTDPIINPNDPKKGADGRKPATDDEHKDFALHIFPATTYLHVAAVKASPLHGPWPETRRETTMSATLKAAIPKNTATDGLADWETGGQVPSSARGQLWEEILLGTNSFDVATRAITDRIQRRKKRERFPAIMEGLVHLQKQSQSESQTQGLESEQQ
ncbi:hypothetical protein C8035_v001542 [Colletotrichum spinosum]|uniref:Uncharacterized protein n=1 Tax=Colletotrichum spinosum TaxID=1347390 RepID=A0A4R8Q0U3_9PEZI|nr:hypothetical protein C8035_v001542 [Colletotrichum spinosum]